MYYCEDCKENFYEPKIICSSYEKELGLLDEFMSETPYEFYVCPYCLSRDFEEKGENDMKREIIDINEITMTFEETNNLNGYVWKNDKLIPEEMFDND